MLLYIYILFMYVLYFYMFLSDPLHFFLIFGFVNEARIYGLLAVYIYFQFKRAIIIVAPCNSGYT